MEHKKPFLMLLLVFTLALATPVNAWTDWGLLDNGSFEDGVFSPNWKWFISSGDVRLFDDGGGMHIVNDSGNAVDGDFFVDWNSGGTLGGFTNILSWLEYQKPFNFDQNVEFDIHFRVDDGNPAATQEIFFGTMNSAFPALANGSVKSLTTGTFQRGRDCNVTINSIAVGKNDDFYTPTTGHVINCGFPGPGFVEENDGGAYFLIENLGNSANDFYAGRIDFINFRVMEKLDITIAEPDGDPVLQFTDFNISATIIELETNTRVTDANVVITFDGDNNTMTHTGNGVYQFTLNKAPNLYAYSVNANRAGSSDADTKTGAVTVSRFVNFNEVFTFTPIENVEKHALLTSDSNFGLIVFPLIKDSQVIWKLTSTDTIFPNDLVTALLNPLDDDRRYKVFTASETDFNLNIWNFDDTLTFGSTVYNSLQKVYDRNYSAFAHHFEDTLLASEVKYFKMVYYEPDFHWKTIGEHTGVSQVADINGILADIYQVSFFSPLEIRFNERLPGITSSAIKSGYAFQFTAWSDIDGNGHAYLGNTNEVFKGSFPSIEADVNQSPTTLTANLETEGFPRIDLNSLFGKTIFARDYAITARGFFREPLQVLDAQGNTLPAFLEDGRSYQFIIEGEDFKLHTSYFDDNGAIDFIDFYAYVGEIADANRIKRWRIDAPDGSLDPHVIDEMLGGIIDTLPDAPNRDIKLVVRLVDLNSNFYEIQSTWIRLVQFPFFPEDMRIGASLFSNSIGTHLQGQTFISTRRPEVLRGIYISAYTSLGGDANQSDFNKFLIKDEFFSCNDVGNCGFLFDFKEWVFETPGAYTISFMADITTEQMNTDNERISFLLNKNFDPIGWETQELMESFVRTDQNYRDDETTMFVLRLRDNLNSPLRNEIEPFLVIQDCGLTISCLDSEGGSETTVERKRYSRSHYIYDQNSGYNWYFYRNLLLEDFGALLEDKHFYRIGIEADDQRGKHVAITNQDINLNRTGGVIQIEAARDVNAPVFRGVYTLTDAILQTIGSGFDKPQQAPKPFMATYKLGEQEIDALIITIGNQNSDYSEDREEFQQFITARIDWRELYFNDQDTARAKGAAFVDSIAGAVLGGLNILSQAMAVVLNPGSAGTIIMGALTSSSISSVGQSDFNALADLVGDEREIRIMVIGLDMLNRQDFPVPNDIPIEKTREWLIKNERRSNKGSAIIEFWQNGLKISEQRIPNNLVESFNKKELKEKADINATGAFITTNIDFHFDLVYNSGLNSKRLTISKPVKAKIDFSENIIEAAIEFGNSLIRDPIGALFNFALGNPIMFAFIIFMVLIIVTAIVIIKGRG